MKEEYSIGDVVVANMSDDSNHTTPGYHDYIKGKSYIVTASPSPCAGRLQTMEPGTDLINGWNRESFRKATKLDEILLGVIWQISKT